MAKKKSDKSSGPGRPLEPGEVPPDYEGIRRVLQVKANTELRHHGLPPEDEGKDLYPDMRLDMHIMHREAPPEPVKSDKYPDMEIKQDVMKATHGHDPKEILKKLQKASFAGIGSMDPSRKP